MADVIGSGLARRLVDVDGDSLDDGDGKLNVIATIGVGAGTITTYPQDTSTVTATSLSSAIGGAVNNCKEIIIQADFDNASFIMVGDSGILASDVDGIRINAGDTLTLPFANTTEVYFRSDTADQKVNIALLY